MHTDEELMQAYYTGYGEALADIRMKFKESYRTAFTWDDINSYINELCMEEE